MSPTVKAASEQYTVLAGEETPTAEAVFVSSSSGLLPAPAATRAPAIGEPVVIVAPTNLPGGYEFAACVNGETVTVKVPPAGVMQGQTFTAAIVAQSISHNIPTGRWRDGICDCFANGCCNAMFWCGWCCRVCALGQVMTRMKLDPCGRERRRMTYWTPFKVLMFLSIGMFLTGNMVGRLMANYMVGVNEYGQAVYADVPLWINILWYSQMAARFCFLIYALVLTIRTRKYIRDRYQIPVYSCGTCEDCCCSFWCSCCTVLQMARHTADYETYQSSCCTETGLPAKAPCVVQ